MKGMIRFGRIIHGCAACHLSVATMQVTASACWSLTGCYQPLPDEFGHLAGDEMRCAVPPLDHSATDERPAAGRVATPGHVHVETIAVSELDALDLYAHVPTSHVGRLDGSASAVGHFFAVDASVLS